MSIYLATVYGCFHVGKMLRSYVATDLHLAHNPKNVFIVCPFKERY